MVESHKASLGRSVSGDAEFNRNVIQGMDVEPKCACFIKQIGILTNQEKIFLSRMHNLCSIMHKL